MSGSVLAVHASETLFAPAVGLRPDGAAGATPSAAVVNVQFGPVVVPLPSPTTAYHSYSVAPLRPGQLVEAVPPDGVPAIVAIC